MARGIDECRICNVRTRRNAVKKRCPTMLQAGLWKSSSGAGLLHFRRRFQGRIVASGDPCAL